MSNGGERVIINPRERVISNDHNRLQALIAKSRALYVARLYGDRYARSNPGVANQIIVGGQTPMVADVFGGLFVRVDDASSLFIDPGVVGVIDPNSPAELDDTPYKIIEDPGIQTAGMLPFLANGGPGRRIDLVVADVVDVVLETDNRDIYEPSTGLFSAQQVNKIAAKRLSYSIIRGTPGAGIPTIPNQIVLAVASVPAGATSWANVTFWDVRPLVQARADGYGEDNDTVRKWQFAFYTVGQTTVTRGEVWTTYGGYRVGGLLKKSTPTATMGTGDVDFDVNNADNSTTNAVLNTASAGAVPIFALFPAGLARWARYSEGAAPGQTIRAPYGPVGIHVAGRSALNDKLKIDIRGNATNVALPSSTGLGATANGVLLWMGQCVDLSGTAIFVPASGTSNRVSYSYYLSGVNQPAAVVWVAYTISGGARISNHTFDFAAIRDGNIYGLPQCAKEVCINWTTTLNHTVATPAPDVEYRNLTTFVGIKETNQYILTSKAVNLDDGTTIPPFAIDNPYWVGLPYNASAAVTPVSLHVGINGSDTMLFDSNTFSSWKMVSQVRLQLFGYSM